VTQGAEHVLAMSPSSDRLDAARRLHDVATTAIADLRRRYGDSRLRRSWVLRGVVTTSPNAFRSQKLNSG
jgi:hypothetical protein